jgi:predicted site-specific integrase-resolvase
MSLVRTWYTPAEAESMFGVRQEQVAEWIDEGLVRFEKEEGKVARVNIDDIKLQVERISEGG